MSSDIYRRCGCRDAAGKLYPPLPDRASADAKARTCPRLLSDPKHGSWGYAISGGVDPATGKRVQPRKMGFATKAEAQKERAAALTEVTSGRWKGHQTTAVGEYLIAWLRDRVDGKRRPSTAAMYRRYVEQDIIPALGRLRLAELRRAQVDKFIRDLERAGRGATTIRRIHATLSSALSTAETLDLVDYNAAAKVALPTVTKAKITMWEPSLANTFLTAAGGHRLGAMFELEVRTGLRRGELCGLRWSDVDFDNRELHARVQLSQVRGKVAEGPIKTESGQDRTVSLDSEAIGALMVWKLRQDMERDAWGADYVESGRVFTYENGEQLRPDHVSRVFASLVAKAELPKIRFHDLRHLHASLLIAAGVPLAVISKRLGHSTISITSDLYGHLLRDANRDAAEAASSLLQRAAS
ncbi:site-specific integrase [Leifsonia sp. AG29]|uniref:site-specific integrase n=1 Tax=Leifsonia sp. AG29 TaxID=2598860 RepID=UPI00131C972D|nr:site-specific integrase [Leifsonia sp. AG29]